MKGDKQGLIKMTIENFIKFTYILIVCVSLSILSLSGLFGYYIYKSYEYGDVTITQTQDGKNNNQEINNVQTNANGKN